jgi:hypothetical protein
MDLGRGDWVQVTETHGTDPFMLCAGDVRCIQRVHRPIQRYRCSRCKRAKHDLVVLVGLPEVGVCPCILRPLRKPRALEIIRDAYKRLCEPA